MASRILWFASENGRKFSFYGTCFVGMALFSTKFLPNTFFLENYQNIVQMYRMGLGVPVSKKITDRFEQVLVDMEVRDQEKKSFKLFTVYGFDVFHAGTTLTKMGAIIGIPKNYSYDSDNEIEKSEILVNQRLVPWESAVGKALQDSIVISPEAQKYAMACQITICRSLYVYLYSSYPLIATIFAYGSASYFNRRFQLFSKKIAVRGCLYSIIGMFSYGLWALATDVTTTMYERRADRKACDLGPEYVRGGVEFYRKIANRNVALRELMGSEGKKIFTALGNDQTLIRQKHLPITSRKDYTERRLNELNVGLYERC